MAKTGIPGLSFSLNRALGITRLKRSIAKATGIPTTRSGQQKKLGRLLTGSYGTSTTRNRRSTTTGTRYGSTSSRKRTTSTGIPGFTFSLSRALGITQMKQSISRATGIPLTKGGRQRKLGSLFLNSSKKKSRR